MSTTTDSPEPAFCYVSLETTIDSAEGARRIAHALLEARLAACVQISGPIESRYMWHGALETATEWRCTIKARASDFDALERTIREIHPYVTPEIIALPIVCGNRDYLGWLDESTQRANER